MHFDEVPFSLVGTATIDWLAAQLRGVPIDARRLPPNLVVRTAEPFIEESWLGHPVQIGTGQDAVHAVFDRALARCVMVGMRQPGLAASGAVPKRIAQREDNPNSRCPACEPSEIPPPDTETQSKVGPELTREATQKCVFCAPRPANAYPASGAGGGEPVVFLTQPLPLGQRGLPVLLQLPGNQAVLRLYQLVLAPGPRGLVADAFQALPPDPVYLRALDLGRQRPS